MMAMIGVKTGRRFGSFLGECPAMQTTVISTTLHSAQGSASCRRGGGSKSNSYYDKCPAQLT